MNKTFTPKKEEINRSWVFLDAKDKILGTIASEAARKLIGKDKATYSPHMNLGDKVVITNAQNVAVTGNKLKSKVYNWHTGYPKGLRRETLEKLMDRKPTEALRRAIKGMLPKNKLQKERMANLYIYAGSEHPHQAQQNGDKS